MTIKPLSGMTAAAALTGAELFYAQQAGADVKVTASQITGAANIIYASQYPGATITAQITAALADVPAKGSIVDCTDLSGSLNSFSITVPCTFRLGPATYTLASGQSISIGPAKAVIFEGYSPRQTHLVGSSAAQKLIQFTGLDNASDSEAMILIRRMTMDGAGVAGYGVFTPDNSGSFTMANGHTRYEDLYIHDFQTAGIWTGQSNFFTQIQRCIFENNVVGLHSSTENDCYVFMCEFLQAGGGAFIETGGTQQRYHICTFVPGQTGTPGAGPDIKMIGGLGPGVIDIVSCQFGNEGEINTRVKIQTHDATTTTPIPTVHMISNRFFGVAGQTCIQLDNPVEDWIITGNRFAGFSTIFNDATTVFNGSGHSLFKDNIIAYYTPIPVSMFANGGRGFDSVEYPPQLAGATIPNPALGGGKTQNRVRSEDFTTVDGFSWGLNNVSQTISQTDPAGTAKAVLFTTPGGGANINVQINCTGLLTDTMVAASGPNGRCVVRLWLKANTGFTNISLAIFDWTTSATKIIQEITMTAVWTQYEFVAAGINPANTTSIFLYPAGQGNTTAGSFFVAFAQVSDFGNPYIVGTGTTVASGGVFVPYKLNADNYLGSFTVAGLPASPAALSTASASNGRKIGEGGGSGTGVPVYFQGGSWRTFSSDQPVAS